jgi:diacylglycerol O-acyltransferase
MKQLSGTDNIFLTQEKGNQTAHVGGLAIYDPSTAPGGHVRFKSILEFYTRRMSISTVFRRRLVRAPLDLDRPYWIDEPQIDVEYHIRHIALPHPGDWRQLMIQVARLHARPLDLSKPAWEAYVIEGLDKVPGVPKGSFAMYTKFHHSAIDGQAGAKLIFDLHSLSVEADSVSNETQVTIADRVPTTVELLSRMVGNRYKQVKIIASLTKDLAPLALNLGKQKIDALLNPPVSSGRTPPKEDSTIAVTRFNHALSPHRVVEACPVSLADCQVIRDAFPGVTINDIFLTASGGAMRKYLESKGELPKTTLRAQVPVSVRSEKAGADAGNQIGVALMPIYTQIADPVERLQRVAAGAVRGKKQSNAAGKELPAKLSAVLPSYVVDKILRKLYIPTFNLTVSNVRGPAVPLFMARAQLRSFMPINMLLDGMALSITGFSYDGILWVCVVADRAAMPDPAFFAQCFRDSMAELIGAARKTGAVVRLQQERPARSRRPRATNMRVR